MTDASPWTLIVPLALATFAIRFAGARFGARIPTRGPWARAMRALPGSLIVALVAVSLASGGVREWAAGGVAAVVALVTRSLPLTMIVGIAAIWALRHWV